jgi:hypothetical protein
MSRAEVVVAVVLGLLLLGYMFLGRGFAHIGVGPIYIGDAVLIVGIVAAIAVVVRRRALPPASWALGLLGGFVALGAIRTFPYVGIHGVDALRDGVLWGYAGFALVVYVLADRRWLDLAREGYRWTLPVFALWLPISWYLFALLAAGIDRDRPGEFVPLVFFKAGDMAVHMVGVVAFLILVAAAAVSKRTILWRAAMLVPLLAIAFAAGTANRGALVTFVLGLVAIALLTRRRRNWIPLGAAMGVLVVVLIAQTVVFDGMAAIGAATPSASGLAKTGEAEPAGGTSQPPRSIGVANADYELGTPDRATIFGWTSRSAEVTLVSGGAHEGDQFASFGNPRGRYDATLRSSSFAVDDHDDIRVSVWTKALDGRPGLEVYVDWYDADGELMASDFIASQATDGRRAWQRCEGARAVRAGAVRAELLFYESRGHATLGIDDVKVTTGDLIEEPPAAVPIPRRPATIEQLIDNITSIFSSTDDGGLEGTKQFRLEWWGTIVDYTVLGDYFWTGKGFGVNLADADGFQSTADHSLRAPHNSHMTVLARMGVPGLALWLALQAVFAIGLLRAIGNLRRSGDTSMAVFGAWILVYWFAMMIDTSFDPYLEGPQGGIWFWTVFGLGLVVMRLTRQRTASE